MHARDRAPTSVALQASGWDAWTDPQQVEPFDGPGLLVSPMFWLGGAISVALWGCVTVLALQWL